LPGAAGRAKVADAEPGQRENALADHQQTALSGANSFALPAIPVIDASAEAHPARYLLEAEPGRFAAIAAGARRHYGSAFMAAADALSRRWLRRNCSPYGAEIAAIAATIAGRGMAGGWFLNVSFEWSCTCALAPAPGGGMRLLRVLDWPLDGLGANLVAARQSGPAGPYMSLTWPGFAGVVTGLATGRFAAALNQAPMPRYGIGQMGDWAVNRLRLWPSRQLPPMHLLRRVFERCADYDAARRMLMETPIAIPAIFALAGAGDEGCVIERTAHRAFVHPAPMAITNHWLTPGLRGRPRGQRSDLRLACMEGRYRGAGDDFPGDDFQWLVSPVLNRTTRLAASLDAATGRLVARGWEADGPATAVLRLQIA
jgi:hypothetical protein